MPIPQPAPECKKPNRDGWAKCNTCNKIQWLPDLGSNQGPRGYNVPNTMVR